MTAILTLDEIRAAEKSTCDHMTSYQLMERAGTEAAAWIKQQFPGRHPVRVLAGPGNNGGDAWIVARELREAEYPVTVVFSGDPEGLPADAAAARQAYLAEGGTASIDWPEGVTDTLIVDGLFGIGLNRAPEGIYASWIARINAASCPVISLDIPSGINGDSGNALGTAVQASHTLTFIAAKVGLYTADGPDHCGTITILDLGVKSAGSGELLSGPALMSIWPRRHRNTHKGQFGSTGILGGSSGMAGAALLAGTAALKSGAGRVWVALLDESLPPLLPVLRQPELMTATPEALLCNNQLSALVVGPGMGQSARAVSLLDKALSLSLPLVLDADALNLVSAEPDFADRIRQRQHPTLLTPHPGEARRLLGEEYSSRFRTAIAIARRYNCPVVLKGCGSLIANPEGKWWINTSGNAGLSAAGMGDVLSGTLGALLGQSLSPIQALQLAVYVHGAAADLWVARGIGPVGLTASEVADGIRQVLNGR